MIPWGVAVITFILGTGWGVALVFIIHRIGEELSHRE